MRRILMGLAAAGLLACTGGSGSTLPASADSGTTGTADSGAPAIADSGSDPGAGADPGTDTPATLDTLSPADVPSPEDTGGPTCLTLPKPTGAAVTLKKGPYLQSPTSTAMTIAFEADKKAKVEGQVGVWRKGDKCLLALKTTAPTEMDVTLGMNGIPVEPVDGYLHAVTFDGLLPETAYEYAVVIGGTASSTASFRTAPTLTGGPFTIGLFGDNRTYADAHKLVVGEMAKFAPDVFVNTGDALATGGSLPDWDGFFAIEGDLLKQAPLMPAFGNHEAFLGQAYYAGYWHLPNAYDVTELNYAWAYGRSYWIVLDSNDTPSGERLAWIEQELVKASKYPYRFLAFHHPMYTFSNHLPAASIRKVLKPLLEKYGVSAVMNGHNHCYERFEVDGIHYIVTGGGGAPLYGINDNVVTAEKDLRKVAKKVHHFLIGEFTKDQATFKVHDVDNDMVIDTFTLLPKPIAP